MFDEDDIARPGMTPEEAGVLANKIADSIQPPPSDDDRYNVYRTWHALIGAFQVKREKMLDGMLYFAVEALNDLEDSKLRILTFKEQWERIPAEMQFHYKNAINKHDDFGELKRALEYLPTKAGAWAASGAPPADWKEAVANSKMDWRRDFSSN